MLSTWHRWRNFLIFLSILKRDLLLWLLFNGSFMSNSFVTPWTVAHKVHLSKGFPRQEYWSRLPFPSPRTEPASPALAGGFFTTKPPGKP